MSKVIKILKDNLYQYVVDGNADIKREYDTYVREHINEHNSKRFLHWWVLFRLNLHYRGLKKEVALYYKELSNGKIQTADYYKSKIERKSIEELYKELSEYDVVSFDIFDTALYRKVEFPNDVFTIMAIEMGHNDFLDLRKKAESEARLRKDRSVGTREVNLQEIYDILEERYGIERKWMMREMDLEIELSIPNPYIFKVYQRLLLDHKKVVFMSDMYLPASTIKKMLHINGYTHYDKLYLSNEYGLRKGDGKLQKILLKDYEGLKVVHIGDTENSDVKKSIEVGLDAIYNPASNLPYRESDLDNLGGSFYRAIINTQLNSGVWDHTLQYEHGFRTGGILTVGFCKYINNLVKVKNIDKILFCARDCEIIWKAYNQFFKECENEYVQISRFAIMNISSERYLYDLSNRYIMRYIKQNKNSKTIETILCESGFSYLVDYLEEDDIDKFLFPSAIDIRMIEQFIFNHKHIIEEHNRPYVDAAKKYFSSLIENSKNILIVDIGWSGTCITALKYFIQKHFPEREYKISGALMCTSRGKALTTSLTSGEISAYVYSPFHNMDLTRFIMPGGAAARSAITQDLLHMPLEFMFTSTERSLAYYKENENGEIIFEYAGNVSSNVEEIQQMQQGIIDFVSLYQKYTTPYEQYFDVSPYVAFNPLKSAIGNRVYTREVYKNFTYDAFTALFSEEKNLVIFDTLFQNRTIQQTTVEEVGKKRILFVTPELTYTGTPRSLLRMCKVAVKLGYYPIVWSAKSGPFIAEYMKNNIEVKIVTEGELNKRSTIKLIKSFDMAVCNTIVTDKYARVCSFYIPTVWYIREATNIPDFTRNNPLREYTLLHSRSIYCVSDYAADAIKAFTKHKISVVHNSVEDETNLARPYIPGTGKMVRFVQFGTMEYRKGYDVLLAAYLAMPKTYQDSAELYFAGGFINSGAPYCSYLFSNMKGNPNIHYLGIVRGEENKIATLSQMDVVVVASRDESCSLVALEGAMLSKPLIVTENVGAKYMVTQENGFIVKTADVDSLKYAMMQMIDKKATLAMMGAVSRKLYEQKASMDSYTQDMADMFMQTERKHDFRFWLQKHLSRIENGTFLRLMKVTYNQMVDAVKPAKKEDVIVSLTSHPGRIKTVTPCIRSLLNQSCIPQKVLLYLSKEQFPKGNLELPEELLKLEDNECFSIKWVDDDIAPHKKYFYAMQEYPELPVIITDDDVIYENTLIEKLMNSYRKFPNCISAMRANLMMFRSNGELRCYDGWLKGYRMILDIPSYQLMPTGVGGVLYPPHSIPKEAFDISTIKRTCLYTDDLWLKMHAVNNGYPTVVPRDSSKYKEIEEAKETALWKINVHKNNNDISIRKIVSYFNENGKTDILRIIRKDRFC